MPRSRRLAMLALALAAGCGGREPSWTAVGRQTTADQWKVVFGADFNLDGMADVLWNDAGRNEIAVWLMAGNRLLSPGPRIPGPSGDGWVAITAADLNQDGMADAIWNNTATPAMAVWLMAGDQLLAAGPTLPGPPGSGWNVVNAGDFDFDGLNDVLWHNVATSEMSVWLMAGAEVRLRGPILPAPSGPGWTAANVSDFDGDGLADILWYDSKTNRIAIWLMRGTELLRAGPEIEGPPGVGWAAVTSADFNADGMADVLWASSAMNRAAVWLMAGTAVLEAGPEIPGPPGSGWTAATAADCDGSLTADIIWQNVDGQAMAVWLMHGAEMAIPGPTILAPAD